MSTARSEARLIRVPMRMPLFDRAVEQAQEQATFLFFDGNGYPITKGFPRNSTALYVEFDRFYVRSGVGGGEYVFVFKAFLERSDDPV